MLSRREFMGWLAGAIPVAGLVERAHAISISHLAAAPETLDAVGEAVLPPALGSAQIRRVVAGFRKWIDGYRENAEVNHAYGNSRLRFTGPTPATRWTSQLDALDASARSAHGRSFAAITVPQRQTILRAALAAERSTGLPSSPDAGTHVAAALLGFFYGSSAATDLCYEVVIGRNQCRPLAESSRHPVSRPTSSTGRVLNVWTDLEAGS
jgi:hypothetical protein